MLEYAKVVISLTYLLDCFPQHDELFQLAETSEVVDDNHQPVALGHPQLGSGRIEEPRQDPGNSVASGAQL